MTRELGVQEKGQGKVREESILNANLVDPLLITKNREGTPLINSTTWKVKDA